MGEAVRETATTVDELKALGPTVGVAAGTLDDQATDDAAKPSAGVTAKAVPARRETVAGWLAA